MTNLSLNQLCFLKIPWKCRWWLQVLQWSRPSKPQDWESYQRYSRPRNQIWIRKNQQHNRKDDQRVLQGCRRQKFCQSHWHQKSGKNYRIHFGHHIDGQRRKNNGSNSFKVINLADAKRTLLDRNSLTTWWLYEWNF